MKYRFLLVFALFLVAPFAYSQQHNNKIDYSTQSYDLVFDRPNCILSVIPMESLPKIKSLTIRGELGNDDVSIIFDKCTDLEYLDLKNTSLKTFNITDFSKVSKLRVFKMPTKVQRLEVDRGLCEYDDLFKNCLFLEDVELPSDLVYIRCNLFNNCPKITKITFPAKVHELVCEIESCSSLTTVDLSHCTNISQNWPAVCSLYRLRFKNCPKIETIKFQSGDTRVFGPLGEPNAGVCYYFAPNPNPEIQCQVGWYENCTLIFKKEVLNYKDNPVKNCTIICPKSMLTHFYVEFNGNNNEVIGLTDTEMKNVQQIVQQKREQRRQEQIKREQELRRESERERKEAEEKQRKARIESLKSAYSPCRFLFATEDEFVSCITQYSYSSNAVEYAIKALIDQKTDEISSVIVKGTEFKSNYSVWNKLENICNIFNSMRTISPTIANYAENKMENFVTSRGKLNKAYNKAKKKALSLKYSDFLISYIRDNREDFGMENAHGMVFLMANAAYSFAPQTSFGLTAGIVVKKVGMYVGLNGNIGGYSNIVNFMKTMEFEEADYECDNTGNISGLPFEYSYSGNKKTSYMGITAGMVYKIRDPIYARVGLGYGYRNVFWELNNGNWAKCIDDSTQGIAIDAGLMYNIGNLSLSLGVQTIGVKYMEAKIGVGFNLKIDDKNNLIIK